MYLCVCVCCRRHPAAAEETSHAARLRGDATHTRPHAHSPHTLTDCTRSHTLPHTLPPPLSPVSASHALPHDAHTPVSGQPRLLPGLSGDPDHSAGLACRPSAHTHRAHAHVDIIIIVIIVLRRWTHISAAVPHHQTAPDRPPPEQDGRHPGALHALVLLRHAHPVAAHRPLQEHAAAALLPAPCYLLAPISSLKSAVLPQKNQSPVRSPRCVVLIITFVFYCS